MNCTRITSRLFVSLLVGMAAAGCSESLDQPEPVQPTSEEPASNVETQSAQLHSHRNRSGQNWLDRKIQRRLKRHQVDAPKSSGPFDPDVVELGRNLFFDKELSGNRDVACSTCHHPEAMTGDALSLPAGVGGVGTIPNRRVGPGKEFIPRNSPEIFNRGLADWETMFWDARVEESPHGSLITPAGQKLQKGLDGVLAAQAMFPVTSRAEMRGFKGDGNELSAVDDADLHKMWSRIMDRLLKIPGYRKLFRDAFPNKKLSDLKYRDAANAIATFEKAAFTFLDSPFDRYLRGDTNALTTKQKKGAAIFYGKGGCASCHSGTLTTDQEFHNIGAPQIGPGKGSFRPLDPGRYLEDQKPWNKYAFRTPPLRNVEVTGPYMHSGAYKTLRGAIEHHLEPSKSLKQYDGSQLRPAVRAELHDSSRVVNDVLQTLDWRVRLRERVQQFRWHPLKLDDRDVDHLVAFLKSMTSPSVHNLNQNVTPKSVPSGLPVHR